MQSLLAIEWLKLKRYRTFWILIGMFAVLLALWNYGIGGGFLKIGAGDINLLNQAYAFSNVWQNLGFWTGVFVVFLSVLVVILTTNEYQFRTNRQNVIDGWSRAQFYHAKWFVVVSLAILTTLYVFILGFIFGISYSDISDFPGNISKLFYVFVISLNYYGFALLLSIFFKRSGITIGLFFLYSMIIESILKAFVNWRFETKVVNYLPLQCSDELLPFPLVDMVKTFANMPKPPADWTYVVASFCWIIIYYIIGRLKILRSDW